MGKFIYKVWIARFGCPLLIVNEQVPENQAFLKKVPESFNGGHVQVAAYHPQSNGKVQRRHKNIVDTLVKLMAQSGKLGNWPAYLATV